MNSPKTKYLLFTAALLLALTTPLIAGSASAFHSGQTTAVVPVNGYVRHETYHYRTYERPDTYVVYRDYDGPYVTTRERYEPRTYVRTEGPYVYREYYDDDIRPGLKIKLPPILKFQLGY